MKPDSLAAQRPARATRGKRLSKLLDEEAEADEEFWNQDAFKEEESDTDFDAEPGEEDSDEFDSDFDDEEPSSDDGEAEDDERTWVKKRKILPGRTLPPASKKSKKKRAPLSEVGLAGRASETAVAAPKPPRPPRPKQAPPELLESSREVTVDVDGEKTTVRKSTRKAVIVKQAMREAQRVAMEAMAKPVKKKEPKEERKMTQEEMLLEAAKTEVLNRKALEIMLAREEEVKKKAIIQKAVYSGPQIRYHSKDGVNTIEFTHTDEFPEEINSTVGQYPKRSVCVITGLPARYRDPQTGLPYATKEAFQAIRERYSKGDRSSRNEDSHQHQRRRTKVEREYPIPGKAGVVKVKYKRSEVSSIAAGVSPTSEADVRSTSQAANSLPSTPSNISPESDLKATALARPNTDTGASTASRDDSSGAGTSRSTRHQPPPEALPRAMFEANEADFMLEDLEVSLPSNLDMGLTNLSLDDSSLSSSMMQSQGMSRDQSTDLQHEMLDLPQPDQDLLQRDLLPLDVFGSII